MGSPWAFIVAGVIILVWGITGPMFHYSDTWQLIINTGTTIVTFLMVFLIQNTQNRDARAMHLKLDELLRAVEGAHTGLVDLENCSDEELERLQKAFERLREREHGPEVIEQLEELDDEVDDELDNRRLERTRAAA
jgi:low affinity Fe/Cu permease